jgi:ABC-type transport system involved in multi-copper enzyme maturation permease subunit
LDPLGVKKRSFMRWGPGPVFVSECLTEARRWQTYAARAFLVSALLIGMGAIWWAQVGSRPRLSLRVMAEVGQYYFYALVGVELALVMLAAPAATAGAICVDRARGTLAHMLVTDLSNGEIVLGKLGARLLPVFGLVACSWPVMALGTLLGGIEPAALVQAFGVIVAVAVLGCAMALALSVWARKPHEVVMACYTLWGLALLAYFLIALMMRSFGLKLPPPEWPLLLDPFWIALAPYVEPPGLNVTVYVGFVATCFGLSAALVVLAIVRVRHVATHQSLRGGRRTVALDVALGFMARMVRRLPAPWLDGNPVLWREWHRTRPSQWMTLLLLVLVVPMCIACLWEAARMIIWGIAEMSPNPGVLGYILLILFGFMMMAAIAPLALSEERQRGSLDVLLATPLTTRQIVVGKWLGTYRLVLLFLLCPAVLGFCLGAADNSLWFATVPARSMTVYKDLLTRRERLWGGMVLAGGLFAHGALVTSAGLLLATWVKRQSRAIVMSVSLFFVVAVAWPFLVLSLGPVLASRSQPSVRQGPLECYAALSPYALAVILPDYLGMGMEGGRSTIHWATGWSLGVAVLALVLFEVTVRTFDRKLGRVAGGTRSLARDQGAPLMMASAAVQ